MPKINQRRCCRLLLPIVWAYAAAMLPTAAFASGFMLREGSTDWMATSFAGDTAKAYDASTVWSNPAGMVLLQHSEIDGSINGFFPRTSFSGFNTFGPGLQTPGTTGGNLLQMSATAGVYAVWNATPEFKLGFGFDMPYGQRLTNPGNFVGRYQSLVSAITDEQFTVSAAYRITDRLSIGGGPVVDVLNARLTQALYIGPSSTLTGDPVADLHGSDTSIGFNIGALYQVNDAVRVGIDYRSRIQHGIAGWESVYVPPLLRATPLAATLPSSLGAPVSTRIAMPDSATIGVYWQVTPELALMSDVSWTNWSLFNRLDIVSGNPSVPPTSIQENWRDTIAVSVGANYQVTPRLMLQGGVGFDQSPATDDNRTSRVPDSNRYEIGIGIQYQIAPHLILQAAYQHVFFASASVNTQALPTSGVLIGNYDSSANTASLGARYRF